MSPIQLIATTILVSSTPACQVKAQDVLLEEDVNADTVASTTGPNKKYFSYSAIGLAFPVSPDSAGSRIYYGKSFELFLGRRIKWRVCNFYAFGLDLAYRLTSYNLRPMETKVLPNDSVHGKELLRFHNMGVGFYNRFNYGKRGNYIGNYIDLGVSFDIPFITTHVTEDKLHRAGANNGRKVQTKTNDLRFIEDFSYSAYFRLGFNKYAFTASYRLSDLFIRDANVYAKYGNGLAKYPELPVINAGFEIGVF